MRSCIIVPCYNEEDRLPIAEYRRFLSGGGGVDLLFVNDGSTDGTQEVLSSFRNTFPDGVDVLQLEKNSGKGEAVRQGAIHALGKKRYAYIAYFDADLATPLEQVFPLAAALEKKGSSMSFGSRVKRLGVRVERKPLRHYVGRIFATEASLLLGLPVYDTQCGAKLFSAELGAKLFQAPFLSRWFFDVEIFFRLKACLGGGDVGEHAIEVPLEVWVEKGDTKVRFSDFLGAPFELLRIFFAYRGRAAAARYGQTLRN
jgi:glycosyltransferase involved in cell wall biosynthesis